MTSHEKTLRVGLSSREAFQRWIAQVEMILEPERGEVLGWDLYPPPVIDHSDWPLCRWALGQVETGEVVFRDTGEAVAEMTVHVDHSDPDMDQINRRLDGILRRYGGLVDEGAHVIDPPSSVVDPQPGAAPDERTDPDQPL